MTAIDAGGVWLFEQVPHARCSADGMVYEFMPFMILPSGRWKNSIRRC
jgi:hypothetical protein